MTKSSHTSSRDLAAALQRQTARTGATTPAVRGADWRLATVTAVGTGTVTADGIVVRCLETYTMPLVGDVIAISQSSSGNWIAFGRTASVTSGWTPLALSSGCTHPGHGYTPAWLREGPRIYMRGRIGLTGGSGIPNGTSFASIPVAIRPAGGVAVGWAVARDGGAEPSVARVEITDVGVLRTYDSSAPLPTWVALDGVTYTLN